MAEPAICVVHDSEAQFQVARKDRKRAFACPHAAAAGRLSQSLRGQMTVRLLCLLLIALALPNAASAENPATVYFASGDGRTEIVGYLFSPAGAAPHPAIVMLHGRAGPYSTNVNADCTLVARSIQSP